MRTLDDLVRRLQPGERVLLRADLNVPLRDSLDESTGEATRVVGDDTRIRAMLPTLTRLREAGAAVLLCSHLGRPKGAPDPALSLAPVARELSRRLGFDVELLADEPSTPSVRARAEALRPGDVVLLENLRFFPGEKANDPEFAAALAGLARYYVDDAFGSCHRAHASIAGVTQHCPAFAGDLVRRELEILTEIRDRPERPFWVILGGAKVSDKLAVVRHLQDRVDGFLVGGGMANTFLAGLGVPVGDSKIEP
ncbi:MAG: phosphoglycerate kinase, partial [Planctomycetes bacterium]|nr:phosphoglycerate kinase [Planctomycetota bacterium]